MPNIRRNKEAMQGGSGGGEQQPLSQLPTALGRAFGGALIFILPMLMTMEMWWLGFYMERHRLALLLLVNIPLLVLLARHIGFERSVTWGQACRDAAIGYGVGVLAIVIFLAVFGVITWDMPARDFVGSVAIQSVPASIGALLARSLLGEAKEDDNAERQGSSYSREIFLMCVGALILGLNVAPTEEMVVIAYKMTPWQGLALVVLSITLMHAFVYAVEFKGSEERPEGAPWWSIFLRYTVVGYALVVLMSIYVLWTFGRTDNLGLLQALMPIIVLSFPAAIGAAAARLII